MALKGKLQARFTLAKKTGKLILNFLKIDRVPDEFAELTAITEFRARGNKLKELPAWLASCRSLREVDLADNPLTAIPDSLSELPELRELRLEGTRLRNLPASLAKLKKIERIWLSPGVTVPPAPKVKAAVERAREFQEEMDKFEAAQAASSEGEPAKAKPRMKAPWKRLGGVASLNASLSVLLGDAAKAAGWDGPRSPLRKNARQLSAKKIVDFDGVVIVDSAAGVGTGDVVTTKGIVAAIVEPDWDWILEEVEDPAAAGRGVLAAIAKGGKPLGRIEVPGGKLTIASGWSDLTEHAGKMKRLSPAVGAAKELDEDGLMMGVKPGTYKVERCSIPMEGDLQACAIVLRRP